VGPFGFNSFGMVFRESLGYVVPAGSCRTTRKDMPTWAEFWQGVVVAVLALGVLVFKPRAKRGKYLGKPRASTARNGLLDGDPR
jgi:hypothetical protein